MATYERALLTMIDHDEDWKSIIIDMRKGRSYNRETDWSVLKRSLIGSVSIASILKKTADPFQSFVE